MVVVEDEDEAKFPHNIFISFPCRFSFLEHSPRLHIYYTFLIFASLKALSIACRFSFFVPQSSSRVTFSLVHCYLPCILIYRKPDVSLLYLIVTVSATALPMRITKLLNIISPSLRQTLVKAPKKAAFVKYVPVETSIVSCHSQVPARSNQKFCRTAFGEDCLYSDK